MIGRRLEDDFQSLGLIPNNDWDDSWDHHIGIVTVFGDGKSLHPIMFYKYPQIETLVSLFSRLAHIYSLWGH